MSVYQQNFQQLMSMQQTNFQQLIDLNQQFVQHSMSMGQVNNPADSIKPTIQDTIDTLDTHRCIPNVDYRAFPQIIASKAQSLPMGIVNGLTNERYRASAFLKSSWEVKDAAVHKNQT